MKYEEIQELLNKYWEGETSLEEERRIKTYFNSTGIDKRLEAFAPLFQALRQEQEVKLNTKTKILPIRHTQYYWAMAASVVLLLTAGWWIYREQQASTPIASQAPTELPKTPEQAIQLENNQKAVAQIDKPRSVPAQSKKNQAPKRKKATPSIDPETAQAMAEIKAALALVSSKLDKGRQEAIKGASYLETMDKVPKRKAG
ncbi:MAG: hypothetical protein ACKVT2_15840 [Saprospiraceae bacterium]